MPRTIVLIILFMTLQSCAAPRETSPPSHPPSLYSDRAGYGSSRSLSADSSPHAGQWAVAIVGTPVYLAFKTVICGASLVVAAPTAAVITLADSPYAMGVDKLGDGIAANCGPPYVLSPS